MPAVPLRIGLVHYVANEGCEDAVVNLVFSGVGWACCGLVHHSPPDLLVHRLSLLTLPK